MASTSSADSRAVIFNKSEKKNALMIYYIKLKLNSHSMHIKPRCKYYS